MFKRLTVCIVGTLVALGLLFAVAIFPREGDDLYDCNFQLSADKSVYKVGDPVQFTFIIAPNRKKRVYLYEMMENNILLRPLEHSRFRRGRNETRGTIRLFELRPGSPLAISMHGSVKPSTEPSKILIDFGEYGSKTVPAEIPIEFYAKAYPAKVRSSSSAEWPSSNKITLTFSEK